MPDLHWTVPVARWSSWPAAASAAPDIGFIEPIVRRRLSTLSRVALKVAHDCVAQNAARVVFASRHGELRRTTDILRAISAGEPVSPTAFSLSVLNAMTGVFGIARGDRSAASAISAGAETLGYALLEAHAQYATQPDSPMLLVYADEPADPAYGTIEDEVPGGAIAILLDSETVTGELACVVSRADLRESPPVSQTTAAEGRVAERESAPASEPVASEASSPTVFATQSQAVQHCLETGLPAAWQGAGATWHWSWHDRAGLDYCWRFCATGMAFVVFGVCGVLFSVVVFPLAWVWPHRASRQFAVTSVIHWFFRALVAVLQRIGVMELEVSGVQALRAERPAIVVANHPTYLDVMVLLSLTPHACCVVKNAHWSNPCFWGIVRSAEYVSNADPAELVEAGAKQLAAGYTMIIFPEGTRSPGPNRLHAFSRGFAHMALKVGAPIVPVLMDCDPPAFTKQMRWYDVPARAFRMRVNVLEPLGVDQLAAHDTPPALAARSVTSAVEAHITQHLFDYGFFKTGN